MGFFKSLFNKITNRAEIEWDQVEADIIGADIGVKTSLAIVDELRDLGRKITADDVVETARKHIAQKIPTHISLPEKRSDSKPCVILVIGVNGVGKTTSCAKLALWLKNRGNSVLLAAADTFRAAAVEQLERWGNRLEIEVVKGNPNADPSSVCYNAHSKALASGTDFLICDTAGRLHTRHNLMEELTKIRRVIAKQDETAPHTTYLVVDATTGANTLQQAREFHKACAIDGLIITKMDGSGRGGIIVPIYEELKIPPVFIGTGEEPKEFSPFDAKSFIEEMV